jgi:hypothetical protein
MAARTHHHARSVLANGYEMSRPGTVSQLVGAAPTCSGERSDPGTSTPRPDEVAPVADAAARAYVERHDCAGTYVASRLRHGLWARGGALLGVVGSGVVSAPRPRHSRRA